MSTTRKALALAIFVLIVLTATHATAGGNLVGAPDPVSVGDAKARLKAASSLLGKSSTHAKDLVAAMEELAGAYERIGGKESERNAFRRSVEAFWLKALTKFRAKRGSPDVNRLAPVNVLAAKQIAGAGRLLSPKEARTLSLKIRKAIVRGIAKRRDPEQWDESHLTETFAALAALNDHETLLWMADTYRHSKEREVVFLVAAHRAMVKFRGVKGRVRHEVCDLMISGYAGVESAAERASGSSTDAAMKRIWDRIRLYTIPVLQHYAGKPLNEKGQALSTVNEFLSWWNDHKDRRDEAWKD